MIYITGYDIARKKEVHEITSDMVRGSKYEHIPFQINVNGQEELNRLRTNLKQLHQCDVFMIYKEK